MAKEQVTYEKLFFKAFNCSPNESKPLEEYSQDELIQFIHILKNGIDILNINHDQQRLQDTRLINNQNFGLSIIAENEQDLRSFQEICLKYFLPISYENCHISSQLTSNIIDDYLNTGISYLRCEYAMIVLLKSIQHSELSTLSYEKEYYFNNKSYKCKLKILNQNDNESIEELLTKVRYSLLGDGFVTDHDDHASIPSVPAPKEPQFVSILPYTQIACWHLPGRHDFKEFKEDLGITHILTLLNDNEVNQTKICNRIKSAGIESIHIPIEGADLSVYTSSQATVDVLMERLPAVRDLLLNSTITKPVKMIIHCSAGLHRTGSITYLLLRLCHFTIDQALLIINRTRAITAREVGQKRIDAVEYNLLTKIS